jgi:hypothetical protein
VNPDVNCLQRRRRRAAGDKAVTVSFRGTDGLDDFMTRLMGRPYQEAEDDEATVVAKRART